jgi:hypothetical protein
MTKQHSVGPPDELIETWIKEWHKTREYQGPQSRMYFRLSKYIAICSAQWGADQELDGCCEWLRSHDILEPAIDALRAARRPKPPSLKVQALALLQPGETRLLNREQQDVIRRALEALPDD